MKLTTLKANFGKGKTDGHEADKLKGNFCKVKSDEA